VDGGIGEERTDAIGLKERALYAAQDGEWKPPNKDDDQRAKNDGYSSEAPQTKAREYSQVRTVLEDAAFRR
jgi:hypothetical protein